MLSVFPVSYLSDPPSRFANRILAVVLVGLFRTCKLVLLSAGWSVSLYLEQPGFGL